MVLHNHGVYITMPWKSLQDPPFPRLPSERFVAVRPLTVESRAVSVGDALPPGVSSRVLQRIYEMRKIRPVPAMNPASGAFIPPAIHGPVTPPVKSKDYRK